MTFSLLAYDASTRKWGGVAATGNLCVGGWVLRGRVGVGLSASQGHAPNTIWGENVLDLMQNGRTASTAVGDVVAADNGAAWRQLTALDMNGSIGAHTGTANGDFKGHLAAPFVVASGNILAGAAVLEAMVAQLTATDGYFEDRLVAALDAGRNAGGDARGLRSAALLVLACDAAPLSLRVDSSAAPIEALRDLLAETREPSYRTWLDELPTPDEPYKKP
jgi:uncharacterized Ntn-hydrolase superfamily protein